jgi:hypothetical protein
MVQKEVLDYDVAYREITAREASLRRRLYHRVVKELVQQAVRHWLTDATKGAAGHHVDLDAVTASVLLTKSRRRSLRLEIAEATGLPSGEESISETRWRALHEQRMYQYTRNLLYYSRNQERIKSKSRAAKDAARERARTSEASSNTCQGASAEVCGQLTPTVTEFVESDSSRFHVHEPGGADANDGNFLTSEDTPRFTVAPTRLNEGRPSAAAENSASETFARNAKVIAATDAQVFDSESFDTIGECDQERRPNCWSLPEDLHPTITHATTGPEATPATGDLSALPAVEVWTKPWNEFLSCHETDFSLEDHGRWLEEQRPRPQATTFTKDGFAILRKTPSWGRVRRERSASTTMPAPETPNASMETGIRMEYDLQVDSLEEVSAWNAADWTQFVHEWTGTVQPSDAPANWQHIRTIFRRRARSSGSLSVQREDSDTSVISAEMMDLNLSSSSTGRREYSLDSTVEDYFEPTDTQLTGIDTVRSDVAARATQTSCRAQARQRVRGLFRQGKLACSERALVTPRTPLRESVL